MMRKRDLHNLYNLASQVLTESKREAKQLINQGKLTQEEFDKIVNIDPSDEKKYTGWLARAYIKDVRDQPGQEQKFEDLRNTVEEFHAFVRTGALQKEETNIQRYKTLADLQDIVNKLNATPSASKQTKGDLARDFQVVVDNETIRIVIPYTHEASRKLGLTPVEQGGFAFRDCEDGKKDSAWCTTYSTSTHWNQTYAASDLFYILIKGEDLKKKLTDAGYESKHFVVALARVPINDEVSRKRLEGSGAYVSKDSEGNLMAFDAYDGLDGQMKGDKLQKWLDIVGIA